MERTSSNKKTSIGLAVLAALCIVGGIAEAGLYGAARAVVGILFIGSFIALAKPSLVLPGSSRPKAFAAYFAAGMAVFWLLSLTPQYRAEQQAKQAAQVAREREREALRAKDQAAKQAAREREEQAERIAQEAAVAAVQRKATMAEFNQLREGMTYEQAVEIIGGEGEVLSSSDMAGYQTVMFKWDGSGSFGANMNAMFQNGRMISKAQFGLQ